MSITTGFRKTIRCPLLIASSQALPASRNDVGEDCHVVPTGTRNDGVGGAKGLAQFLNDELNELDCVEGCALAQIVASDEHGKPATVWHSLVLADTPHEPLLGY